MLDENDEEGIISLDSIPITNHFLHPSRPNERSSIYGWEREVVRNVKCEMEKERKEWGGRRGGGKGKSWMGFGIEIK